MTYEDRTEISRAEWNEWERRAAATEAWKDELTWTLPELPACLAGGCDVDEATEIDGKVIFRPCNHVVKVPPMGPFSEFLSKLGKSSFTVETEDLSDKTIDVMLGSLRNGPLQVPESLKKFVDALGDCPHKVELDALTARWEKLSEDFEDISANNHKLLQRLEQKNNERALLVRDLKYALWGDGQIHADSYTPGELVQMIIDVNKRVMRERDGAIKRITGALEALPKALELLEGPDGSTIEPEIRDAVLGAVREAFLVLNSPDSAPARPSTVE